MPMPPAQPTCDYSMSIPSVVPQGTFMFAPGDMLTELGSNVDGSTSLQPELFFTGVVTSGLCSLVI